MYRGSSWIGAGEREIVLTLWCELSGAHNLLHNPTKNCKRCFNSVTRLLVVAFMLTCPEPARRIALGIVQSRARLVFVDLGNDLDVARLPVDEANVVATRDQGPPAASRDDSPYRFTYNRENNNMTMMTFLERENGGRVPAGSHLASFSLVLAVSLSTSAMTSMSPVFQSTKPMLWQPATRVRPLRVVGTTAPTVSPAIVKTT